MNAHDTRVFWNVRAEPRAKSAGPVVWGAEASGVFFEQARVEAGYDGRLELVVGGLLMPAYARSRAAFDTRAPLSLWSRR